MKIEEVKGYGIAISDLEANWDDTFKKKLKAVSQKIIFQELSFMQKLKLVFLYYKENRKAQKLDLSDIKARGMTNMAFLNQQLEYISMFSALSKVLNTARAIDIMKRVMEATVVEAFSKSTPEQEAIDEYGNNFEFFRNYFAPLPESCRKAGCLDMHLTKNNKDVFQLDIRWCIWLELATKMVVPEACIPNCYADDLAYPLYFEKYGIKYSRQGTLANGACCCDLKFEKKNN
ncbi:MAG: L-2-amino-thiazoline-4-carboxylic acid hydrolase [Bacteroidales bacterium]